MPNCFQLYRKGNTQPEKLTDVDKDICNHLGIECHEIHWAYGWHDNIGFLIACANDCKLGSQTLRDKLTEWVKNHTKENATAIMKILDFLEKNYTSDAWATIGKG